MVHRIRADVCAHPHPFSHEALSCRLDHAIFFREQVPGGLRLPCWCWSHLLNAFQRNRPLHRRHDGFLIGGGFVSYRFTKPVFRHPYKTVSIRFQMRSLWMRWLAIENLRDRFTLVGSQRRDVHESLYPFIGRTGHYRASVSMSNPHDRPACSLRCSGESCNVICERSQRNGSANHINAETSQRENHILPTRSVSPSSMH